MNTKTSTKAAAPAEAGEPGDLDDLMARVKVLEYAAIQHGWDLREPPTDPNAP